MHRATPEQWAFTERQAKQHNYTAAMLLELRDRIAALEEAENDRRFRDCKAAIDNSSATLTGSNHPAEPDSLPAPAVTRRPLRQPSPATIAECCGPCEQGFWHCDCGLLEKMNPELSAKSPSPAGGLVAKVTDAVVYGMEISDQRGAIDAILAVADWLENHEFCGFAEKWLREEVERHG